MSTNQPPYRHVVVIHPARPGDPISVNITVDDFTPKDNGKLSRSDKIAFWAAVINIALLACTVIALFFSKSAANAAVDAVNQAKRANDINKAAFDSTLDLSKKALAAQIKYSEVQNQQYQEINKGLLQISLNLTIDSSEFITQIGQPDNQSHNEKSGRIFFNIHINNIKSVPIEMISRQESTRFKSYSDIDPKILLKEASKSFNIYADAPVSCPANDSVASHIPVPLMDRSSMDLFQSRTAFVTFAEIIVYRDVITKVKRKLECVITVTYRPNQSPEGHYLINRTDLK